VARGLEDNESDAIPAFEVPVDALPPEALPEGASAGESANIHAVPSADTELPDQD